MSEQTITTSIFPITNCEALSAEFNLFRIHGLLRQHPEYFANRSKIELMLKRLTRAACITYEEGDELLVAVHHSPEHVPESLPLVRANVRLEKLDQQREVSFDSTDEHNRQFCLNVLHFLTQGYLGTKSDLWQLGSGRPHFSKKPMKVADELALYRGFSVRPVALPDGRFGLAVDTNSHVQYCSPLPTHLTRNQYKRWSGSHCIYHYTERSWYEVRLGMFSELNVSQVDFSIPGVGKETLLEHLRRVGGRPLPREVADLPNDASVVGYYHHTGEARNMPAALCYPTATLEHPDARAFERFIKPKPSKRLELAEKAQARYLSSLSSQGMAIETDSKSFVMERKQFRVPDLRFGNDQILSTVRNKQDAVVVRKSQWGKERQKLLESPQAGYLDSQPLGRQYLLMPESVMDSYGPELIRIIHAATDKLLSQEDAYPVQVVTYDDRGARTSIEQGRSIVDAATAECNKPGHALVVVHDTDDQRRFGEDQLAALVIRELAKLDVVAAVSHTEVPNNCFKQGQGHDGTVKYYIPKHKRGLISGYARGLVLNKILLNNERWPFALESNLQADITVGIDVKNNTAGFLLVGPKAKIIRTHCSISRNKEKLSSDQIAHELYELISAEAEHIDTQIESIVIHRDGRVFDEELRGIEKAVLKLKQLGHVSSDATSTVLEIKKSSLLPLRLFDAEGQGNARRVRNVNHGTYAIFGEDSFICTTGYPFQHHGTVRPLQVVRRCGEAPLRHCLQDIFKLSCLAFTKPDDCSRLPLTLRLLDRRLRDEASQYDEDSFRFQSQANKRVSA